MTVDFDPSPPPRRSRAKSALMRATLLLAALLGTPAIAAISDEDLLPVDQAFALSAQPGAPGQIAIGWVIADGYYLYRHRISVQADAGFAAQALQLPRGKAYEDEFFGKVEIYRGRLAAILPGRAQGPRTTLTIKYQGCADAGICYPPQTRQVTVAWPTAAAPPVAFGPRFAGNSGLSAANLLGAGTRGGVDALPLPPEQAFGFEAIAGDGNTLLLRFSPAPGYYLYRDRTSLQLAAEGVALGAARWPPGTINEDEYFGRTVVYFDRIDLPVALLRRNAAATPATLTASFQGCQTDGICYPPMTRTVTLVLPAGRVTPPAVVGAASAAIGAAGTDADPADAGDAARTITDALGGNAATEAASARAATVTNQELAAEAAPTNGAGDTGASGLADDSRLAAAMSGPNRWWALLSFFGFGLLLAFTPCVLPMIPILSGLIAGHGPGLTSRKAFTLSLVYVLANALVFTVAGVIAGLVGANLQIAFQMPSVIAAFALLFVALALSSFGLYQLQLPAALRTRLGALTNRQHGGSWLGVAAMGALSALIVGPCVAPPLAAAVLYIGQAQDPAFGGAALFLLAMGMGVPLIAFGVAAGRGLPTSGPWMIAVQRAFGFVFLGLAVWMLSRVLPGALTLGLWGALALGAGVMTAMAASKTSASDAVRALVWTAAALLGVAGGAQMVGALAGSSDPLQPLAGLRGGADDARGLPFRAIKSLGDLDREVAAAQAAGQPLLLDFYADWCVSCKEMEKYTFPDPAVRAALAGFVLLKADVTANDPVDQALMKQLRIIGPPATLYFVGGAERRELRLFGFEKATPFAARAQRVGTQAATPAPPVTTAR